MGWLPVKQAMQLRSSTVPMALSRPSVLRYPRESAPHDFGNLADIPVGREKLLTCREVHAQMAGVLDRGRGNSQVHLAGPAAPKHGHELGLCSPSNDGVIDHHEAFVLDILDQWVVLHARAHVSQALVGHDERAHDVAVLDETFLEGNAGLLGIAHRGGYAGSRGRR